MPFLAAQSFNSSVLLGTWPLFSLMKVLTLPAASAIWAASPLGSILEVEPPPPPQPSASNAKIGAHATSAFANDLRPFIRIPWINRILRALRKYRSVPATYTPHYH